MLEYLQAAGLAVHVFHHDVVDVPQGGAVLQHLPGEVGVVVPGEDSRESFALCGLLHDLCKAQYYKVSTRNVKNDQTI